MTKTVALLVPIGLVAALAGFLLGHFEIRGGSRTFAAAQQACGIRKFYLTKNKVTGDGATRACATDYHMASLYEIANVSGLQYDTSNGVTAPDSGSGPPTSLPDTYGYGWIRTGELSNTQNLNFGSANCTAWSSGSLEDTGSAVGLNDGWIVTSDPARLQVAPIWRVELGPPSPKNGLPSCAAPHRVWCLQN
jgi:hypothetical protein